jgi:hypothetical protein
MREATQGAFIVRGWEVAFQVGHPISHAHFQLARYLS